MTERVGISPVMETANAESASQRAQQSESPNRGVDRFLRLQRAIGNRATQSLLAGGLLQPKLRIGPVDDVYEREADQTADRVMRMPDPHSDDARPLQAPISRVQRMCPECEEEEKEERDEEEEQGSLQKKSRSPGQSPVKSSVESRISSLRGGGQPLPPAARSFFEPRFGHDFSDVRLHTGATAAGAAAAINARAFTLGRDIVFGAGQGDGTGSGRRLLAHELTHVVQQSRSLEPMPVQRQPSSPPTSPPAAGGLTNEMLQQIARRLREAMAGWGTDEEAIYAAMAGRSQDQVNQIERVYGEMYPGRSLQPDLEDELTESELKELGKSSPLAAPGAGGTAAEQQAGLADVVAAQLDNAMDRLGTDEEAIYAALTGRTSAEREAIKDAYERLTSRELEADLREELSGSERIRALRLLNQGMLQGEDELYLAMAGLGTDEETIFRVLDALAGRRVDIESMESRYRQKYGDLIADLRGDLSGDDYERALRVLGPVLQDVAFEDCPAGTIPDVRKNIDSAIAKVTHAIAVLGTGWSGMSPPEKVVFNQYYDPSGSGGVDEQFVRDVRSNYQLILNELGNDLVIECETQCDNPSPYAYLDASFWIIRSNIHVCPPFLTTSFAERVKTIIHEAAHLALVAYDRPMPGQPDYSQLTPRGPGAAQIPVIGALIRVIARSDTLYAPEAYALFAYDVP